MGGLLNDPHPTVPPPPPKIFFKKKKKSVYDIRESNPGLSRGRGVFYH